MDTDNDDCALCGVAIAPHDGTRLDDFGPLQWRGQVRAVRTRKSIHKPFITGSGFLNYHREVCADPRYDFDITGAGVNLELEAHELKQQPRSYWCFPVHDFCWQLLLYRIQAASGADPDPSRIAHHLFAIWYNTPAIGSHRLLPGYDRGVPDLRVHFHPDQDTPQLAGPHQPPFPALRPSDHAKTQDIFASLPNEIVMLILEFLPSSSICSLRYASRCVATSSQPSLLGRAFWASRFQGENELAFVFAQREHTLPPQPVDWCELYFLIMRKLKHRGPYWNRQRIWNNLDHVIPQLRLRQKNELSIVEAPVLDDSRRVLGHWSAMASGKLSYGATPATPLKLRNGLQQRVMADEDIDAGCRVFESQVLNRSKPSKFDKITLAATIITHLKTAYITGLRLFYRSGNPDVDEEAFSRVGYISTANEKRLDFDRNDVLKAFRVRLVIDGIVGLCFDMKGSQGDYTREIGDFANMDVKSGVAEIVADRAFCDVTFLVQLDAWKLVSMQLNQTASDSPNDSQISSKRMETDSPVLAEIWSPTLPAEKYTGWHIPASQLSKDFSICLQADASGADGELLGSLAMLTIYMGVWPQIFLGLSFVYDDGSERLFGQTSYMIHSKHVPCIAQTFMIAGREGEMITELTVGYAQKFGMIQSIIFRTNFGRQEKFELQGDPLIHVAPMIQTMIAPAGQVISGFFIRLNYPAGQFSDMVACTVTAKSNQPASVIPQAEALAPIPPYKDLPAAPSLVWRGGYSLLRAKLAGIRRIHISSGMVGSTREPHCITGLQLDYLGNNGSTVIGQWLEYDETLALEPGEEVTGIVTWHSVINTLNRIGRVGLTLGLEITTSKGKRVGRQPKRELLNDAVCVRYRANSYEALDSIIWLCHHRFDEVKVSYTPRSGEQDQPLIFDLALPEAPDGVAEKIFIKGETRAGKSDPVVAIEATFKSMSDEPSSLGFVHQSGNVQILGTRGERPEVQSLNSDERLIRLDIQHIDKTILNITFLTSSHRELRMMHGDQWDRSKHLKFSHHARLIETEAHEDFGPRSKVFEVPAAAGEFVGLWTIPAERSGTLSYLMGPIWKSQPAYHGSQSNN